MENERPRRKSLRAPGYDYSAPGTYVVTICTEHRACVLGHVVDGVMRPNTAGQMVYDHWLTLAARFPTVALDEFALLPNHLHGILRVGWETSESAQEKVSQLTLGKIVQWFKSITTSHYGKLVEEENFPPYPGRFWQRNYFERIIRTEAELEKHREYIAGNAAKWSDDLLFNRTCRESW